LLTSVTCRIMSRFLLFVLVFLFLARGITPIHVGCPQTSQSQNLRRRSHDEGSFRAPFDKLDKDGNQELTHEEIKDITHAETVFGTVDLNKDDKISYEEYENGVETLMEILNSFYGQFPEELKKRMNFVLNKGGNTDDVSISI